MTQQSTEPLSGETPKYVKDMHHFGNPFNEFLYKLKTSRLTQLIFTIGMVIIIGGGYWLFIYVPEYNPQGVGGSKCKFSDDPDTRMTTGELIMRETGKGIVTTDYFELEPGTYEVAYRFLPWSINSSNIVVYVRTREGKGNHTFYTELTKNIWHAGKGTFETDGGEYYIKVAYVPQPWCFELAKVG